jgi:hypothetical protein
LKIMVELLMAIRVYASRRKQVNECDGLMLHSDYESMWKRVDIIFVAG